MNQQWVLGILSGFAVFASIGSAHAEGFELGARAGYGVPIGQASGSGNDELSRSISGMIPLQLDLGFRVTPGLMLGGYVMYGFGFSGTQLSNTCTLFEAPGVSSSCTTHDVRLGVQVNYHFTPWEPVDPWIGAGFGYEWLTAAVNVSGGGQGFDVGATVHGWELINLQAGVDFSAAPKFKLGPFVSLSVAEYSQAWGSCSGDICTAGASESNDITDTTMHQWLILGVRGSFVL